MFEILDSSETLKVSRSLIKSLNDDDDNKGDKDDDKVITTTITTETKSVSILKKPTIMRIESPAESNLKKRSPKKKPAKIAPKKLKKKRTNSSNFTLSDPEL